MIDIPEGLSDLVEETSEAHRDAIRDRMPVVYADHVMTQEGENVWRCGRPDRTSWHFYVALLPHCIVVYGDIGEMIIRPGWDRGIDWLRSCLNDGKSESFDYMLGKVPGPHRQVKFMPGDVVEACQEYAECEESTAQMSKALKCWSENVGFMDDPRSAWYDAASEAELECEWYCGYEDYSSEMYWCAYALQWFVSSWVKEYGTKEEVDD